ncbi:MAG: HlyD family efflux transporter periplasmic adaptor subunit [Anaerolineales bacterium]|nr:HlyD family efflux transporter periplasmic adaptor subunit [Anaerolineales bacterium]
MNDTRKLIIPLLLIVGLIVAGMWYMTRDSGAGEDDAVLSGSGTVEVVKVVASPELAGRVVEVFVAEGDTVQEGDMLFRLDDELLQAQRVQAEASFEAAQAGVDVANAALAVAQANLDAAQVQYDLEVLAARQQAQPLRVAQWGQDLPSAFDLPGWYFTKEEQVAAALAELDSATADLAVEEDNYEAAMTGAGSADILKAEERLAQAQAAFQVAAQVLELAESQNNQVIRDAARNSYDAAEAELQAAQEDYDDLLSTDEADDLLDARADLALAQERYETALDSYNALLTGEDSLRVQAAETALAQAAANLDQAETKIAQAETAVVQAEAQLALLDLQIEKSIVYAAVSGVVLSRGIEPGEVVQAGAIAMVIGQLDRLTITVFIPEDRYGEILLGTEVAVTVDSFPGTEFKGTVIRIADEAEFTPRNVQTEEGRRTTVFAVEISVVDTLGSLKPGMPADVTFEE